MYSIGVEVSETSAGSPSGPLDHFAISAIASPQTAGASFIITTITAQDVNNNTVTSFTGPVTFSGTAGVTGTSGPFTSGVLNSASVVATVAGSSQTVIVTDGTGHTGMATIVVISAYAQLQILMPGETAAPGTPTGKTGTPNPEVAGTSYNVTINAVDANFNLARTESPTLTIIPSDTSATLSQNGTPLQNGSPNGTLSLSGGTARFQVTFNNPGTRTLTVSDPVNSFSAQSAQVSVNSPGLVLFVSCAGQNTLYEVSAGGAVSPRPHQWRRGLKPACRTSL